MNTLPEEIENNTEPCHFSLASSPNHRQFQMKKNNKNIFPGQMQYKLKKESLIDMDISYLIAGDDFYEEPLTKENVLKLIPDTPMGNSVYWIPIFIMRGGNCLKGALRNPLTDEVALMSSLNKEELLNYTCGTCKSHDNDWRVCRSKMIAPPEFWILLKNKL